MLILLSVIAVLVIGIVLFLNQPDFGRIPRGERLKRIENSRNYKDRKFRNFTPTSQITSDKSILYSLFDFLFRKVDDLRPKKAIPVKVTNLKEIDSHEDILVWLGHSTIYLQLDGKRMLIDPVLISASPVSFANRSFEGADYYTPDDIPDLDYMIVTHDHWDHLDYKTIKRLKDRTGKVICGLGVGEHFERWGFDQGQIIELDWNETTLLNDGFRIHCLPARHFSGRGLSANRTLWVSYMFQSPSMNIYISGDSGYDSHFAQIGEMFDRIDLAIMENGQYDKDWKYIHMLPEQQVQAVKDLHPVRFMTYHHSKYALGLHSWYEPLDKIEEAAGRDSLKLITPMIGQPVYLKDQSQQFEKWWK